MALIKEYFALTDKYTAEYGPNTVVLLQVGAFFEVYGQLITPAGGAAAAGVTCSGSRIDDFCVICELAKANKIPGIVMAGFRDYGLDKYLKKIQDAGYTAVVYVQDGVKNPPVRVLQGIYSPGTFFSTDIAPGGTGAGALSNNIACIWIEKISRNAMVGGGGGAGGGNVLIMGMTNIDIYTGRSTIFETENKDTHNPTTYDEVERFISSYAPSEVILISNLSTREVEDVIHYTNIQAKMIHRIRTGGGGAGAVKAERCSKQVYQMEVLNTFYPNGHAKSLEQSFMNYEIATQSLVFLLNFIYEHNPNLVSKIQEPVFENMSERLVLANHSLRQLNIIDDGNSGGGGGGGRLSSVLYLLNHTITPMGSRAYKYALLHPTFCAADLERDYAITEHILSVNAAAATDADAETMTIGVGMMRERLSYMKDIEKLHRHIILRKITPYHVFCLFHNLRHIRELYTTCSRDLCLNGYLSERWNIRDDVVGKSTLLLDLFENTLNIESCREITDTLFETNIMKRGISAELDKLTDEYRLTQKSLDEVQRVLNELIQAGERPMAGGGSTDPADYVKIHETDKMGISLQATKRRTKLLEDRIKKLPPAGSKVISIVLDKDKNKVLLFDTSTLTYPAASGSNNTIHSPQIYELCAAVVSLRVKISDMVSLLYYGFIDSLHEYYHDFENMTAFVSAVDMIQNRCYVARKYRYCRPVIAAAGTSFVRASGLRHCLIERINEEECYVTNDVGLGGGGPDTVSGMLLYGTNAVGKTSLIRAIGVAVIMAQAGFYVPAASFVYRPYRAIMTRILGNDNLFKGLSTFVVEMSELRVILRMADEHTLVLGDELCSGTEMDSAISIFVAGLQHLYRAGASFIFATHLHEIAGYSEIREMSSARLRLAHMRVFYDKARDTLVYDRKLQDGAGESMYGLEVCKSLHLPDDFLENANMIRVKYRGVSTKTPTASILDDSVPSRYNAAKLRRLCELCEKSRGTEIHHLQHQESADADNFIGHIHKNHPANLASICEDCHREIHTTGVEHVKVKTGKGVRIVAKRSTGPPPPTTTTHAP
jgi:DNA mismatch repair protein MutS